MASSSKNNLNKTNENAPEIPAAQTARVEFPIPASEFAVSKGLNTFETRVFIKAMAAEPGVGPLKKMVFSEWEAKHKDYYSRTA